MSKPQKSQGLSNHKKCTVLKCQITYKYPGGYNNEQREVSI